MAKDGIDLNLIILLAAIGIGGYLIYRIVKSPLGGALGDVGKTIGDIGGSILNPKPVDVGSTLPGAAIGGAIGGVPGAIIGGGIGKAVQPTKPSESPGFTLGGILGGIGGPIGMVLGAMLGKKVSSSLSAPSKPKAKVLALAKPIIPVSAINKNVPIKVAYKIKAGKVF